jgi:predicted RNase H-like nuclease (RuvC/YqgF family)
MNSLGTRAGAVLVALIVAAGVRPTSAHPQEPPGSERGGEHGRELTRQEIQIRRARGITRRILHDRRATPEMQQQASELDKLLERREQIITGLEARHKGFLDQHKTEMAELDELRQRAREIDNRLHAARSDILKASESDIATLKESSTRAADLADALRASYFQQRRERRRR